MSQYSDEIKNGDISDGDSDVIMSERSPRRENNAAGKSLRSAKKGSSADRVDENDEPVPCSSKQISRKGVTKKSAVDHKEKSGSSLKESSDKNQPNIKSMFAAQSGKKKRKSEANCGEKMNSVKNHGDAVQKEKKRKLDENNSSKQESKPTENAANVTKKSFMIERCTECRQILDDKELRMFPGDPGEAVEEFVALTDPRLSLFTGDEAEVDEADQRPQHRLTSFSVYDRMTHLCPFDSGLLEKNKELYFSGYVKPIYDDNPDIEGGICTRNMGPINEWWTTGFDGGENPVVGFSTAFAEYILLAPSESYEPLWEAVIDKVQLSKVVIEFLKEASEMEEAPTYEDLLNRVQITVPKRGASKIGSKLGFTEDSLLQHSQFIVDQIQSYDEAAAEDETILITQPCIRSLVKLTGVTLGRKLGPAAGFKPKRVKGKTVQDAKKDSMATVTPLVRAVFDAMFKGQIEADDKLSAASKRRRCGVCEACQLPDCGKCRSCMDMIKFGGTGRSKQACLMRKCPYMMVKEAEEDDILDDGDLPGGRDTNNTGEDDNTDLDEKTGSKKRKRDESGSEETDAKRPVTHKLGKVSDVKIEWSGIPLEARATNKVFYSGADINGESILVGDHVCVRPDDPSIPHYIAQVRSMWQDIKSGEKHFHARWLNRGSDTILGEVSDPRELFLVDDCQDSPLCFIAYKVKVKYIYHGRESFFADSVGSYDALVIGDETGDGKTFFCQKWYDQERVRFQDFNSSDVVDVVLKENLSEASAEDNKENIENTDGDDKSREPVELDPLSCCPSCDRLKEKKLYEIPTFSEEMSLEEVHKAGGTSDGESLFGVVSSKNKIFYNQLKYNGQDIKIGDCAYFSPDSFDFVVKQPKQQQSTYAKSSGNYEESAYTELYRKSDYIKGSNDDVPDPFRIARVVGMYVKNSSLNFGKSSTPEVKDVNLVVQKFYRPENTHKGVKATHCSDLNLLYWSEEKVVVPLEEFAGKCEVSFFDEVDLGLNSVSVLNEYFNSGVDRFYFTEAYDAESKEMKEVPNEARSLEHNKGKRKGKGKGKGKSTVEVEEKPEVQPLKCLDVFAGCGGLSEGLHQAGIANSKWAIEKDEAAAQAFRLNNPTSVVFSDDCNELLRLVMSGETTSSSGQKLPRKGEVELLCGGPPCQGFSGMNRFNQREYSKFKNSLIASYLSYCDYYRPRYFLLENVRNFVSFKRSLVLKLALRCLISMGYQCTFGILQAGCYGVPQTRRRAIILAAAPGYKLPVYPEPVHSFSSRGMSLSVVVDDRKFEGCVHRLSGVAPLRTITVRDAMYDLPPIHNGAGQSETTYSGSSLSHFQRLIRPVSGSNSLLDHICKEMSPLVLARMQFIPLAPGSDWRDLPNVEVMLKDNSRSKILRYTHDDKRAGKSKDGSLRGVCSCAEGGSCDPAFRQFNTLIPWCLPHTGNRHNHWAGLYGRLEWEGFFSTTVTNPEPMGKQGRVLHPEQHRVVSVRECARSQGFPDSYRFYGTILDKHRQVGNAVPPPMARHIGLEIKKAMILSL